MPACFVNGLDPVLYTLIALDPDNVYNVDVLDLNLLCKLGVLSCCKT